MFEEIESQLREAIQAWHGSNGSAPLRSELWAQVRQPCKDAIIFLASCGQNALAARVEREYEQLKKAWQQSDASNGRAANRVIDAADELCATLVSLVKFQGQLSPEREAKSDARQGSSTGHQDRGIQVEKQLRRYLADRKGRYNKLVPRVKEGDTKAVREFQKLFGPTAFARHISGGDEAEVGRNKNAVQSTQTYQLQIKPLFDTSPRLPYGWQDEQDDPEVDELYSEFLDRLRES